VKRWLITMGGAGYEPTVGITVRDGQRYGADEVYVYDDKWVREHEFYEVNRWLWEHPALPPNAPQGRGYGWYSWKPLIILDALDHMQPGDVVLYIDGDTYPIADFSVCYDIAAREGAMLFAGETYSNHRFCTRDCLVAMGLAPDLLARKRHPLPVPPVQYAQHAVARFMAFKCGPWRPRQLLMEWLTYAVNPMCTTFEPSVLGPDAPGFEEHRTEQTILTNLAHKHGYRLYREACEHGEDERTKDRDLYPQLFSQRNVGGHLHPQLGTSMRRTP